MSNREKIEELKVLRDNLQHQLKEVDDWLGGVRLSIRDAAEYRANEKKQKIREAIHATTMLILDLQNKEEDDFSQINGLPGKETVHAWIIKLAEETASKGSSRYEQNTIEECLKAFINDPNKPRRDLIESLEDNISSSDYGRLTDEKIRGWENSLIDKLKPFYPEYAQNLERTNNSS